MSGESLPTASTVIPARADDERDRLLISSPLRGRHRSRNNLRRVFVRNRLNLAGLIIVVLFMLLAFPVPASDGWTSVGELIAPHSPYEQDIINANRQPPSFDHPMGTDELGRDIFSRILTGTQVSLKVALAVLTFAVGFGTLIGVLSGYAGGLIDEILMRLTDMFIAFPALILAIVIAATLGRSLENTMIALATVFWPWYARLVRGQVLSIKQREFVTAGRSIGISTKRLLFRYILPNSVSVVIIQVTLDIGYAILATSSLGFIGLGVQPPTPEWGTMMAFARSYYHDAWWYITFPGLALAATVFAFNVLGDGLQDALDPQSGRS